MTLEQAREFAINKHAETAHRYDGKMYAVHLDMVYGYAKKYIHIIPPIEREAVLSACWTHDLIEDCRLTYNDIKEAFGEPVAEITYALTNEKGKTRKERASDKYYSELVRSGYASMFVKICDRLANVSYGVKHKSKMLDKYRQEQADFEKWFTQFSIFEEMFIELRHILN